MDSTWTEYASGKLGPLQLNEDGTFSINGMTFEQDCEFENTFFGDSRVNKRSGVGEVMTIAAPDAQHLLTFDGGCWYYKVAKRSRARAFAVTLVLAIITVFVATYLL